MSDYLKAHNRNTHADLEANEVSTKIILIAVIIGAVILATIGWKLI